MKETVKIKRLFLLGSLLTAVIVLVNYGQLSHFIQVQQSAAYMLDISGRQRMLSQRASIWAERLADSQLGEKEKMDQDKIRATLEETAQAMRDAHQILTNPESTMGKIVYEHPELQKIYFSKPTMLDQQVREFLHQIDMLLAEPVKNHENPHLEYIMFHASKPLLDGFDSVVRNYQIIHRRTLQKLYLISVALFSGSLAILGGLWVFAFRPMLTNFHMAMRLSTLQQKVAAASNEAATVEEGLRAALSSICECMGWPVGHAYLYSQEKKQLISSRVWHADNSAQYEELQALSERCTFTARQGLIGRTYTEAKPVWIDDISRSSRFIRREVAMRAGIHSAFAFPVFVGRKVVAVMEFFSTQTGRPHEGLLHAMANIGKQVGQTFERAEFQERAALLETVIESANDGIVITKARVDEIGPHIMYVNHAFKGISGYSSEEVIGRNPRFLQDEFTKRETLDEMRTKLLKGESFKGEILNKHKDGHSYWLDLSVVPVRNATGTVTHYAAVERDISKRKQEEMEYKNMLIELKRANLKAEAASRGLQESLLKAEAANQAKSDFLANMSHELRTPMNGVLGMAQLLADTTLDGEQQNYVSTINGSAENLLMLLNDILDLSKIEAGALTLEHIAFDVVDVLNNAMNLLRPQAEKKGIDLLWECDTVLPPYLWGDPGRLTQIIINLLGNALKFTQVGHVRLVAKMETAMSSPMFSIRVEDTGMGIPAHKLDEIFEKFTQGDSSVTRKFGGTGLGLAITKQLVQLMGGKTRVESVEGKGSTFWVMLPCHEASYSDVTSLNEEDTRRRLQQAPRIPASEAVVLLVEDYPVNQVFAEKLLRKFGFRQIDLAMDGADAIRKYQAREYDVIFMDCQMPELDGYQATRKLREIEEGSSRHTPIIAMTANAMMGDREKCLGAGMDDYLSKPIRAQHLKKAVEKWFVVQGTGNEMAAQPPEKPVVNEEKPVDLTQLHLFTDGDPEEEKALVELFLSQAWDVIHVLEKSLDPTSQDAWKSAAHRLKGASANLGAGPLAALCRRAENEAGQHHHKPEMLAAIKAQTHRIEAFFG